MSVDPWSFAVIPVGGEVDEDQLREWFESLPVITPEEWAEQAMVGRRHDTYEQE